MISNQLNGQPRVTPIIVTYQSESTITDALNAMNAMNAMKTGFDKGFSVCTVIEILGCDATLEILQKYAYRAQIVANRVNAGFGRPLEIVESGLLALRNLVSIMTLQDESIMRHESRQGSMLQSPPQR